MQLIFLKSSIYLLENHNKDIVATEFIYSFGDDYHTLELLILRNWSEDLEQ